MSIRIRKYSYESLRTTKVDLFVLLKFHFCDIICSLARKISSRQAYKNPWQVNVEHKIHYTVFKYWYKAVADYTSEFGRTIRVKRSHGGDLVQITMSFTNVCSFFFHLRSVSDHSKEELIQIFSKNLKNDSIGTLVATEEKPFTVTFDRKKSVAKFHGFYEVKNSYGHLCSF